MSSAADRRAERGKGVTLDTFASMRSTQSLPALGATLGASTLAASTLGAASLCSLGRTASLCYGSGLETAALRKRRRSKSYQSQDGSWFMEKLPSALGQGVARHATGPMGEPRAVPYESLRSSRPERMLGRRVTALVGPDQCLVERHLCTTEIAEDFKQAEARRRPKASQRLREQVFENKVVRDPERRALFEEEVEIRLNLFRKITLGGLQLKQIMYWRRWVEYWREFKRRVPTLADRLNGLATKYLSGPSIEQWVLYSKHAMGAADRIKREAVERDLMQYEDRDSYLATMLLSTVQGAPPAEVVCQIHDAPMRELIHGSKGVRYVCDECVAAKREADEDEPESSYGSARPSSRGARKSGARSVASSARPPQRSPTTASQRSPAASVPRSSPTASVQRSPTNASIKTSASGR